MRRPARGQGDQLGGYCSIDGASLRAVVVEVMSSAEILGIFWRSLS